MLNLYKIFAFFSKSPKSYIHTYTLKSMSNYYKSFDKFVSEMDLKNGIPIDEFIVKMKIYFGFGYNSTIKRWVKNFEDAGFMKVVKIPGSSDEWIVKFIKK